MIGAHPPTTLEVCKGGRTLLCALGLSAHWLSVAKPHFYTIDVSKRDIMPRIALKQC